MSFVLGVVLFALCIGLSIALHEAGHMYSAKAFGMRVRRYFVGFGPTLFSFRRGGTEYGLKAIPGGGFCDIAGMTALDEISEEDRPRAFYRFATWKRVVVLSAGSLTHFAVGILLIYVMAVSTGLPNVTGTPVVGQVSACVPASQQADGSLVPCAAGDPAPARDAGLEVGDRIVAVAGRPVATFTEVVEVTRDRTGPTPFLVERDGEQRELVVDVARVQRLPVGATAGQDGPLETVGAIGLANGATLTYGPGAALGETLSFTGTMFANTWEGLKSFPSRIPPLVAAIGGEERAEDTPISVVGASVLGGDAVDARAWVFFLFLLAGLNFFVGVFNLLPLLPLDGGHIAVNLYERARNGVRRLRGRPDGPPVDYTRLLPLTYAVMLVFVAISALTITADVVNPIRLQ